MRNQEIQTNFRALVEMWIIGISALSNFSVIEKELHVWTLP